jgi:5-methylcytosine-specific restriction endonuclease McrA
VKRTCLTCDAAFKGKHAQCFACRATDRACISCGRSFLAAGGKNLCTGCLSDDRECLSCGKTFNGTNLTCTACRWAALSKVERAARERARSNARRARKQAAQVSGPVAASVYAAIREEGPCVYCAEPAEVVDHVIPLARGGWEHEDNLVPACKPCNLAKHSKLLGEWDPVRVEHAVLVSTKVADIHFANQIGAL